MTQKMTQNDSTKPFFENLDAFRFLSFAAVFLFHVHLYEYISSFTSNQFILGLVRLMSSGSWGVTFFFTLSGFLITWLLLVELQKNGKINIKAFYMRRVLRIWPLYYLVFFIGTVLLPILYHRLHIPLHFPYPYSLYGTFLSNFGAIATETSNQPCSYPLVMNISWSVSIEEQFYVVWPLFFLAAALRKYTSIIFLIISIVAAFLVRDSLIRMGTSSFVKVGEIAIGGGAAFLAFHQARFKSFIVNLPKLFSVTIYLAASLVIIVSSNFALSPLQVYAAHMTGSLLFALIILEQNFSLHSFYKFGRLKVCSKLGKISYGLYMLHPLAMFVSPMLLKVLHIGYYLSGPYFMITSFILSIIMAFLSYNLFEQPFLKLKKRFELLGAKRKTVPAPTASPSSAQR